MVPWGNAASAHALGRGARRALEDARERIAALIGAFPDEVTFTSGATEANNLAIFGQVEVRRGVRVLSSPVEHPCVLEPLRQLEQRGSTIEWMPVRSNGVVAVKPVSADVQFATVMLVNHETGAIQPVREVAFSLPTGVPLHCDAAQAVGKLPVDFHALGVTSLSASAHKFGGPPGVGVLLLKRGIPLRPLLFGGHQQQGRRPGTEAVPLAAGMAVALDHAVQNLEANRTALDARRAHFWQRLEALAAPLALNGPEIGCPEAWPGTLNVSFPGCRADVLLMALDLAGVACSTGAACSSGSLQPSPVLRTMGVPDDVLRSALRFSFSASITFADLDDAAGRISTVVRRARNWQA